MQKEMTPAPGYVILQPDDTDPEYSHGLLSAGQSLQTQRGIVRSVGRLPGGYKNMYLGLRKGSLVLFNGGQSRQFYGTDEIILLPVREIRSYTKVGAYEIYFKKYAEWAGLAKASVIRAFQKAKNAARWAGLALAVAGLAFAFWREARRKK